MSTASLAVEACGIRTPLRQRKHALRGLFNAYLAWRLRRRQRAELFGLCDRTLKDIGISWTEIEGIVSSPERDATGRVR